MIWQRIPIDIGDVLIIECQSFCLDKVVDPLLQCGAVLRWVPSITEMVITLGILFVLSRVRWLHWGYVYWDQRTELDQFGIQLCVCHWDRVKFGPFLLRPCFSGVISLLARWLRSPSISWCRQSREMSHWPNVGLVNSLVSCPQHIGCMIDSPGLAVASRTGCMLFPDRRSRASLLLFS